jgi:hypothetical protein
VIGIRTTQQPEYEELESEGNYEIRSYPRLLIATVHGHGSYDAAVKRMFPVLADYIFGENVAKEKIGMTAPVFVREQAQGTMPLGKPVGAGYPGARTWEMSFILPSSFDIDSAPVPSDSHIEVQELPKQIVAAIRFRGKVNEERIRQATVDLENWVTNSTDYIALGEPMYAGYDPPWTLPMLRRQEVLIQVAERG